MQMPQFLAPQCNCIQTFITQLYAARNIKGLQRWQSISQFGNSNIRDTFAILQREDTQVAEAPGDDVEVVVDDPGVEGAGGGLGEVDLEGSREARGEAAQHVRAGARAQAPPLGALDPEPSAAHEPEGVALHLGPQTGEHRAELVVGEHLVDEGAPAARRWRRHYRSKEN